MFQTFAAEPVLSRRFEAQAARRPDAPAVRHEGRTLSYGDLNRRANQLAHRLRALGVRADTLVGIAMERSLDLIVGLMAIHKAGGGYLPMDLVYPRERMEFMLADAGARIVLTSSASKSKLPEHAGTTLCLDTDWPSIASEPDTNPEWAAAPEDLAYVIYTSGSTGKPKGCQVTQANVVRLFTCSEGIYGFGPDDVWTFFHSHAFDFSVWEIWGALLYGGCVVVVP
jgi:non-ribosomal peptide synthetase component F